MRQTHRSRERETERRPVPRLRAPGDPGLQRPALVDPEAAWRHAVTRLDVESNLRERRLRRGLSLADALALFLALLVTVPLASEDPLDPFALLLFPAVLAAAKILATRSSAAPRGSSSAASISSARRSC